MRCTHYQYSQHRKMHFCGNNQFRCCPLRKPLKSNLYSADVPCGLSWHPQKASFHLSGKRGHWKSERWKTQPAKFEKRRITETQDCCLIPLKLIESLQKAVLTIFFTSLSSGIPPPINRYFEPPSPLFISQPFFFSNLSSCWPRIQVLTAVAVVLPNLNFFALYLFC